jgi:hypothetical protein
LFLQNKENVHTKNMFLKLYQYLGVGDFQQMLVDQYLTVDFKIQPE